MNISDFSLLTLTDQLGHLYDEGVYLSKRKAGKMTVLLFQLNSAYVEVFYKEYRRVVHHIGFSESTDILEPYLDSISIENLLQRIIK